MSGSGFVCAALTGCANAGSPAARGCELRVRYAEPVNNADEVLDTDIWRYSRIEEGRLEPLSANSKAAEYPVPGTTVLRETHP